MKSKYETSLRKRYKISKTTQQLNKPLLNFMTMKKTSKFKNNKIQLSSVFGLSIVVFASNFFLVGCQSTNNDVLDSTNYRANTETSGNRSRKSPEEIAKVRTQLAGQYIKQKRLDDAKRQLERVFDVHDSYAPAYDMMGVLLQQEGSKINLRKAESYFKKSINIDPNFMQTRNNYGVYLSYMKRYAESAEQFEIAGSALGYEGRISALENLGRTYMQLEKKQRAIKSFMRALEGDRSSLIARVELIDLLISSNRIPQAQKMFDEVKSVLSNQALSPRLLLQGIKLASASDDMELRQRYAERLLSAYPLSSEAKKLKQWLKNPRASWK